MGDEMTITRIEQLLQETGSNTDKLIIGLKDQTLQWDDRMWTVKVKNIQLDDHGNPIGTAEVAGLVTRVTLHRHLYGQPLHYWVDNSDNPPPEDKP